MECIMYGEFYKKAVKNNVNNAAISKILGHLMYNNFEFSKKRVFLVMEALNDGHTSTDAKNAFELLFHIFQVADNLSHIRLEWIFGIPQLVVRGSDAVFPNLPQRNTKFGDKIVKYVSPLLYGTYHESLLERMIGRFQNCSDYILILNYFFFAIMKKQYIFNYFDALPHPKKDKSSLKDYIFELAESELHRMYNITNTADKFEKQIATWTKTVSEYDSKREEFSTGNVEKHRFKPNYMYGNIVGHKITHHEEDKINSSNMFCFTIDYDVEILDEELNIYQAGNVENVPSGTADTQKPFKDQNLHGDNSADVTQVSQNDKKEADQERQVSNYKDNEQDIEDNESDNSDVSNAANQGEPEVNHDILVETVQAAVRKDQDEEESRTAYEEIPQIPISITSDYETQGRRSYDGRKNINQVGPSNFNQHVQNWQGRGNQGQHTVNFSSEETFLKRNLDQLLQAEGFYENCPARASTPPKLIVSCIKRIIVFNNSDKEMKIKFNFYNKDEFVNCYMPVSEIVVVTKKNQVNNVFTFVKEDINLPWNDISFVMDAEPYVSSDNHGDNRFGDIGEETKGLRRARSQNDLKAGLEGQAKDTEILGNYLFFNYSASSIRPWERRNRRSSSRTDLRYA